MVSLSASVGVEGVEDSEFVLRAGFGSDYTSEGEGPMSSHGSYHG